MTNVSETLEEDVREEQRELSAEAAERLRILQEAPEEPTNVFDEGV